MKTLEKFLLGVIVGGVICIFLFSMTSCSPKGYGCHGNQSWDKMVKRNNRP